MMKDRMHFKDSEQPKSNYFRQSLEALRGETARLKSQIEQDKRNIQGEGTESYIARLQDQGDAYTRKIESEQQRQQSLARRIERLQEQIQEKRHTQVKVKTDTTSSALRAKIRQVENKLDKSLQNYNEIVTKNRALVEEINALRREKVMSTKIKQSLEEELTKEEEALASLTAENSELFEKRDELRGKLEKARGEAKRMEENFKKDWVELNKAIAHEQKFRECIEGQVGTQESHFEEQKREQELLNGLKKATESVREKRKKINESVGKVDKYEETFKSIEEATKITDIEALVDDFVLTEQNNYSLYRYINELNNDIQRLEKQIAEVKAEKDKYHGKGINSKNENTRILSELETRLSNTEARAEEYEKKYEKTMAILSGLKTCVKTILDKVGCNNEAAEEMVTSQGVTEANMMQCLGIIELRTNEILQMNDRINGGTSLDSGRKVDKNDHKKYDFELPTCSDKDLDRNEPIEPMSREKMRDKAIIKSSGFRRKQL